MNCSVEKRFVNVPIPDLHKVGDATSGAVLDYWKDLEEANLLGRRFWDVKSPDLATVYEMYSDKGNANYMVFDTCHNVFCAETMLNGFRGLVAEVHFSVHPTYHGKLAIEICKAGARQHFRINDGEGNCVKALLGLTPVNNRLALALIRKVGFKKVDILPSVFYNGEYTDGVLSKLTEHDLE